MSSLEYIKKGYFDEQDKPYRGLYIEWAKEMAQKLGEQDMTTASLRRFYGQIKFLQPLLSQNFEQNKHLLYGIVPLASYAANKEEGKIPELFRDFIEKNISLATIDLKHYLAFVAHFQSIVAYFKEKSNQPKQRGGNQYASKKNRRN